MHKIYQKYIDKSECKAHNNKGVNNRGSDFDEKSNHHDQS